MATDQEIQELTRLAAELVNRIDTLVGGTGDQMVALAKSDKSHRRMIMVLYVGFVLDIVLTVAMAVGGFAVNNLASKVNNTQELTRSQVLCPLFQQFINSDTPAARQRAEAAGQDMKARSEAFKEIRQSYKVLECNK